ncbi:MAG: MMPL family transporter, partial [Candidatus Dormiibacterota bacterium]
MSRLFSLLGRFDVRFRYPIVLVWVVVTILCVRALPGLSSVSQNGESSFLPSSAPSEQAAQLLNPFQQSGLATATLVVARGGEQLTTADQSAITRLTATVRRTTNVVSVRSLGVSQDGEALQLQIQASVPPENGSGAGATLVDAIRGEAAGLGAPSGLQIHLTGELPTAVDTQAGSASSFSATQRLSIVFIILLLLLAFRSLLAPLVTLLPAAIVLALAGPVITLFSHVGVQVSAITQLLLVVLVLGAGTDYGLFLVFRVREEIRRGLAPRDAVVRAVETVGESITFSALIVIGALISLLIAQFGIYQGLGPALAIGVALMLLAGLTLLPALLAILGRAVFWPSRLTVRSSPTSGWWGRVAAAFIRRPGVTAICGLLIFAALAVGSVGTSTAGFADQTAGPSGSDSAAGQAVLAQHFPTTGAATSTAAVMRFPSPVWDDPEALTAAQQALQGSSALTSVTGPLDPDGPSEPTFTASQLAELHQLLGWPVSPADLTAAAARLAGSFPPAAVRTVAQEYAALVRYLSPDGRTVQWSVAPAVGPPGSAVAT